MSERSAWAVGYSVFAALMLMIIGTWAAAVSAVVNFAWLPYQPWWSILMIILSVAVIWALTVHGRDIAAPAQ